MLARVTRRSFLALIGLAAVPPEAIAAPAVRLPAEVELLVCPVAGLAYYDYARVAGAVAAGAALVLRREPANSHDHRAVEVLTEHGAKLGYIPRADNAALASLMDAGYEMQVESLFPDTEKWGPLWIAVSMIERSGSRSATSG